jgi:hypothetical protein
MNSNVRATHEIRKKSQALRMTPEGLTERNANEELFLNQTDTPLAIGRGASLFQGWLGAGDDSFLQAGNHSRPHLIWEE